MRLLIVSDIHANLPAIREIPDDFDRMVFLGDLVDYGTRPAECISWVRDRIWRGVRGNHDHALAAHEDCRSSPFMHSLAVATRAWHAGLVSESDRAFLGSLPLTDSFEYGGARFRLVHGSLMSPLYGHVPPDLTEAEWRLELGNADADVLLYGHTHLPVIRTVGRTLVVNPGSAGQPRSGQPETSYATWEDGRAMVHRIRYDCEPTVKELLAGPIERRLAMALAGILKTGKPPDVPVLSREQERALRRRCPFCQEGRLERVQMEKIVAAGGYRALIHIRGRKCSRCGHTRFSPSAERFIEEVRGRLYDGKVLDLPLIGVNFYEIFAPD